jgi:hypothetical protein
MLSRALPPRSHRSRRRRVSPLRTAGREKAAAIFRLAEVAAKPFFSSDDGARIRRPPVLQLKMLSNI